MIDYVCRIGLLGTLQYDEQLQCSLQGAALETLLCPTLAAWQSRLRPTTRVDLLLVPADAHTEGKIWPSLTDTAAVIALLNPTTAKDPLSQALALGVDDYWLESTPLATVVTTCRFWMALYADVMKPIDWQALAEFEEDLEPTEIALIAELFISDNRSRYQRLKEVVAKENWQALGIETHALKSSAAIFGAVGVVALAQGIEGAYREGHWVRVRSLSNRLIPTLATTLLRLEQHFQGYTESL